MKENQVEGAGSGSEGDIGVMGQGLAAKKMLGWTNYGMAGTLITFCSEGGAEFAIQAPGMSLNDDHGA